MSDPIGLLLGVCVIAPILAYVLVRLVFAVRAAEQRHWLATQRPPMSPAASSSRAFARGGRPSRLAVSPAAGGPAAEVASPDVSTSAAAESQR